MNITVNGRTYKSVFKTNLNRFMLNTLEGGEDDYRTAACYKGLGIFLKTERLTGTLWPIH